jgi:hypothetical protein
MRQEKSGTSPYVRHKKAEYVYSEAYQQWKAAVLRNDKEAIARQGTRHSRQFGLRE